MLYFNDELDKITDTEIEQLISTLPQQRREQAMKFKFALGRKECALAYTLLCQGLKKEFGITEQPIFEYGEHGKPSIKGHPEVHFNMSHCKKAVMCYVSREPVGVDCEMIGRGNENLVAYTMNEDEIHQIESADDPNTEFICLWTKKEAVLKLTGEGINDNLKNVLCEEKVGDIKIETIIRKEKGYVYSIARIK